MRTDDLVYDGNTAVLVALVDLLGRNVTVDVVAGLGIKKSMRLGTIHHQCIKEDSRRLAMLG